MNSNQDSVNIPKTNECNLMTHREIYDHYTNWSFFGLLDEPIFTPMDTDERSSRVNQGYIVNKELNKIIKWGYPKNRLFYKVMDHIRICEEALAGVFTTDNKEFNLIMRPFIREFMMSQGTYLVYSEELKKYELDLASSLAIQEGADPHERMEKSCPNSNFRLLKRSKNDKGEWSWDCVLSNIKNVDISEDLFPVNQVDGEAQKPIIFSFNEGFMFHRLLQIFYEYEAEFQIYKKLVLALSTVGEIDADDVNVIYNKMDEIMSPEVFTMSAKGEQVSGETTIEYLKLVDQIPNLTNFYQQIRMELMDRLGELGLGVDDTNKRERITVGENTRAMQPTINFQNTILHSLDNFSERIRIHFNTEVKFINKTEQMEQRMGNLNQSKFNKYDESGNNNSHEQ